MYQSEEPKLLTNYEEVDKTLKEASNSYMLSSGYLNANDSITINLRLWLSDDTPLNEETMNKQFLSKVTITTSYLKRPSISGTLRTIKFNSDTEGMWEYKKNITKIVIQNKLNKIDGAIKVSDESVEKNGSIMSYVVANEDGSTYTAYLQGENAIYLNPNSNYLFMGYDKLESIEKMEYLNTSNVTSMYLMFSNCSKLSSLDVSHFNTSNVENMKQLFYFCKGLTELDLSNFDTSKVTDMNSMF